MPDPQLSIVKEEPLTIVSEEPEKAESSSHLDVVGRGLSNFWEQINPITGAQGLVSAAMHPVQAAKQIGQAQGEEYVKAAKAFEKGDYITGARHGMAYLLPLIGPALSKQSDKMMEGDIAGGIGGSFGIGANIVAPELIKKIPTPKVRLPGMGGGTAAEKAAVQFAESRGIPTDAATATGNKFVQAGQFLADRTMGGSLIAERATRAREAAQQGVLSDVAGTVKATASSPEQAGQAIRSGLTKEIAAQHGTANTAYDTLRTIEQQRPIVVDVSNLKRLLQPIRDRMARQLPVTLRSASPGVTAVEQLLAGPDRVPLSMLDSDLSVIKAMAREADPNLRSVGQGIAAKTAGLMDSEIMKAVTKAGPDAVKALQEGRAATRMKYETAEVLGQFAEEPVKAFNQATLAKDAGIERLRSLKARNPGALPEIGRAYLDGLAAKAGDLGGFGHADAIWADWQRLGPETKKLLFSAQTVQDLDSLLLFAKKAAQNPNPSGTGHILSMLGQGELLLQSPVMGTAVQLAGAAVAKLLRTPAGIRALRDGLVLPNSHPMARQAAKLIAESQAQTVGHALAPPSLQLAAQDQPAGQP